MSCSHPCLGIRLNVKAHRDMRNVFHTQLLWDFLQEAREGKNKVKLMKLVNFVNEKLINMIFLSSFLRCFYALDDVHKNMKLSFESINFHFIAKTSNLSLALDTTRNKTLVYLLKAFVSTWWSWAAKDSLRRYRTLTRLEEA